MTDDECEGEHTPRGTHGWVEVSSRVSPFLTDNATMPTLLSQPCGLNTRCVDASSRRACSLRRRGRAMSSPPKLGQVPFKPTVCHQNVTLVCGDDGTVLMA